MNDQTIETQSIVVAQPQSISVNNAMRLEDILAQVKLIQDVMHRVMKEKEHYGSIPGCGDKKTLLQPGAQKLTMTFRLAPAYEIQEVNLERGHKEYRVICTLKSIQSGSFVGQGVGCCSTMESKYRWRSGSLKCPDCGKETIRKDKKPNGGWYCWAKLGGCGAQFKPDAPGITEQNVGKVENDNPADAYNTVLKIAKKRAFVDATITATAASDIFTQDIGDDENTPTDLPPAVSKQEDYGISNSQAMEAADDNPCFDTGATEKPKPAQTATITTKTPTKPTSGTPKASEKHRMKALNNLGAAPGQRNRALVTHWLMSRGWISGTQEPEAWPLEHVPATPEQMAKVVEEVAEFEGRSRQDHADAVRENITK